MRSVSPDRRMLPVLGIAATVAHLVADAAGSALVDGLPVIPISLSVVLLIGVIVTDGLSDPAHLDRAAAGQSAVAIGAVAVASALLHGAVGHAPGVSLLVAAAAMAAGTGAVASAVLARRVADCLPSDAPTPMGVVPHLLGAAPAAAGLTSRRPGRRSLGRSPPPRS